MKKGYNCGFDMILDSTQHDARLQEIDHAVNLIQGQIERTQTLEQIAGRSFYEALMKKENEKLQELAAEYSQKTDILNRAVTDGTVETGSQAWQEMKSDIDGVAQSIQEAETQLLKYEQSIREIASLKFDSLESQFDSAAGLLSSRISQVDKQISLVEEAGYRAGETFYQQLIRGEMAHVEALSAEYHALSYSLSEALDSGSVEEWTSARLDNTDALLRQATEATNQNARTISAQVDSSLSAVGMKLTENFARLFKTDYSGGVRDIVAGYYGAHSKPQPHKDKNTQYRSRRIIPPTPLQKRSQRQTCGQKCTLFDLPYFKQQLPIPGKPRACSPTPFGLRFS